MSAFALPVAAWHEPPTPLSAPAIDRYGFRLDAGVWTVIPARAGAGAATTGELVDLLGTGAFTLVPAGSPPALARLKVAQRGTTTLVYR